MGKGVMTSGTAWPEPLDQAARETYTNRWKGVGMVALRPLV